MKRPETSGERLLLAYEAGATSQALAEAYNMTVDEFHRRIYRVRKARAKKLAGEVVE